MLKSKAVSEVEMLQLVTDNACSSFTACSEEGRYESIQLQPLQWSGFSLEEAQEVTLHHRQAEENKSSNEKNAMKDHFPFL